MGQTISYIQNLSILNEFELHISNAYDEVMQRISITTLNFDVSFQGLPVRNDWRTQETLITTCVPLLIAVCVLLFYQPARNVVWFLLLLTSMTLTAGTAVVMAQQDAAQLTSHLLDYTAIVYLFVAGVVVFVLCVAVGATVAWRNCRKTGQGQSGKRRLTGVTMALERDTKTVAWPSYAVRLTIVVALFVGGLFLSRVVFPQDATGTSTLAGWSVVLGYVALVAGGVGIVCLLLWLLRPIRRVWWRVTKWVNKHFLRLLLIVVHVMYLPVMQNILQVLCAPLHDPEVCFGRLGRFVDTTAGISWFFFCF